MQQNQQMQMQQQQQRQQMMAVPPRVRTAQLARAEGLKYGNMVQVDHLYFIIYLVYMVDVGGNYVYFKNCYRCIICCAKHTHFFSLLFSSLLLCNFSFSFLSM